MKRIALALLFLLTAGPALAQAQTPAPAQASSAARRVLHAAPAGGQIRVDGRLDEPAWAVAEAATDFTRAYPNPGAPPSQRTEARVLVGPDALYVGVRMFDTHPDSIAAQLARRDASGTYSDRAIVLIDSRNDRRTGFTFSVNPRGVKQDTYLSNDVAEDPSWDAVWDVATTTDSLGWTAEFRIPFSQLRFSDQVQGERTWGIGIMREIARYAERDTWSPWKRNDPGFVSRFGELRGLQGIRSPSRLELIPYTSARLERSPGDPADPFYRRNDAGTSVGADLRYGLPGGLTLSATVNPDFGQVELDPAVVNLTAFETFLPERRPFFVEGSDIFRFGELTTFNGYGNNEFFYSRRVGRAPQRLLFGDDILYVDAPAQSTILGAAKVSGKTDGGWSVGAMDALTSREDARFRTAQGTETTPVEPLSNYFVGRLRRDLNDGQTVVGGMLTATHRDMADGVFDDLLRSRAYLFGIDGQHSWHQREWTLSGFLAGSQVGGERGAILRTQRSSARYYQRPDADYLRLDTTRTSLAGRASALALNHGGKWDLSLAYQEATPGFEINDAGYESRTDYRAFSTFVGQRRERPARAFRNASYYAYTNHTWNFGGDRIFTQYGLGTNGTLRNLWSAGTVFTYNPATLNDRLTRGGPLALSPSRWEFSVNGGSDPRKRISGRSAFSYGESEAGAHSWGAELSLSARPTTSLQVSLGPSFSREHAVDQYVRSVGDPLASDTYQRRYVFADLDQTTLALDTRVNWTFSPTLSLQVFAQPFVSAGDYRGFKELRAARTFDFDVYGRDRGTITRDSRGGYLVSPAPGGTSFGFADPNFNVRSLRGNAVLRWEYRPGSALFLVWQQVRSGDTGIGSFDLTRDTRGIFREPAQNVFLVKATYWIGR